jgi:hypothetical protein
MADIAQQIIGRLKLTGDRASTISKINAKYSTNEKVINELPSVIDGLRTLPEPSLKKLTGLSKRDLDNYSDYKSKVAIDVQKQEPGSIAGGRYVPGGRSVTNPIRQQIKAEYGKRLEPMRAASTRGTLGDIAAFAGGAVEGFQADRYAAELAKRGKDTSLAFQLPEGDVPRQMGTEFGYGFNQNFGPTAASIPGLVGGGYLAGAIDNKWGRLLPNNPVVNLLRVAGGIGGAMAGAQATSSLYDRFGGPFAGLDEKTRERIAGQGGMAYGGPVQQLGQFAATSTIFGAPATNAAGRLSFFEGAGINESARQIFRNGNAALSNPAVKETIGDVGERLFSVIQSNQQIESQNLAKIREFIKQNGRVPNRDEKDAMGVLTPQEKLLALAPDILFGGMTRYGNQFAGAGIADGVSALQQKMSKTSPVNPQSPSPLAPTQQAINPQTGQPSTVSSVSPVTAASATAASVPGVRALRLNVNLLDGNQQKPHTIIFDQATGTAKVDLTVDQVTPGLAGKVTDKLISMPAVNDGTSNLTVRAFRTSGDFVVMNQNATTGVMSLETRSFNELPDAMKANVERVLRETKDTNGQVKLASTLPAESAYNPMQDGLKSYASDYATPIQIDGKTVNAAITAIGTNDVTLTTPSGITVKVPKTFFPDPSKLTTARTNALRTPRRLNKVKAKTGTNTYPVAHEFAGADFFVPDPERSAVEANPGTWSKLYTQNIPPPARQMQRGTVINLGVVDGERQVGVVLGFKEFQINGERAGGYEVKSVNDPRMETFFVPHNPYVKPLAPGDNPFVNITGASTPGAATATPLAASSAAGGATGAGTAGGAVGAGVGTGAAGGTGGAAGGAGAAGGGPSDADASSPIVPAAVTPDVFASMTPDEQNTYLQDPNNIQIWTLGAITADQFDALPAMSRARALLKAIQDPVQMNAIMKQVLTDSLSAVMPGAGGEARFRRTKVNNPDGSTGLEVTPYYVQVRDAFVNALSQMYPSLVRDGKPTPAALEAVFRVQGAGRLIAKLWNSSIITSPTTEFDKFAQALKDGSFFVGEEFDFTFIPESGYEQELADMGIVPGAATSTPSGPADASGGLFGPDSTSMSSPVGSGPDDSGAGWGPDSSSISNPFGVGSVDPSDAGTDDGTDTAVDTGANDTRQQLIDQINEVIAATDTKFGDAVKHVLATGSTAISKLKQALGIGDVRAKRLRQTMIDLGILNEESDGSFSIAVPADIANDIGAAPAAPTPSTPVDTGADVSAEAGTDTEVEDIADATADLGTDTGEDVLDAGVDAGADITSGDTAATTAPALALNDREPIKPSDEDAAEQAQMKSAAEYKDFPYQYKFEGETQPGELPVEMEDNRTEKTRYRRQTEGEETQPVTVEQFRNAVPEWASKSTGLKRIVGKLLVPIRSMLDRNQTGNLELDVKGVANREEFYIQLKDVFGQTDEQAALLSEWVDRWSLSWAREFARIHGIRTMDRLRATRIATDPTALNNYKPNDKWREWFREQMLPSNTEANAEVLATLQKVFYTQRLGVIAELTKNDKALLNNNGMTFSLQGDGKVVFNVAVALKGKENFVTQVHEVNHLLVRSLYAPMIHKLASRMYGTYRMQNLVGKDIREIQKDVEERIVTELTNMMFNSTSGENPFSDLKFDEGGFDATLYDMIQRMGNVMRASIADPSDRSDPNNVGINKAWIQQLPSDEAQRMEELRGRVSGTPLIYRKKAGNNPNPVLGQAFLDEPLTGNAKKIKVRIPYVENDILKYKRDTIEFTDLVGIGDLDVRTMSPELRSYMVGFMGHWYDYTTKVIKQLQPDVDVGVQTFNQVRAVDVVRNTVGYKWWSQFDEARKLPLYAGNESFTDDRISERINTSYLGWLDGGGFEQYRKSKGIINVEPLAETSGYLAVTDIPGESGSGSLMGKTDAELGFDPDPEDIFNIDDNYDDATGDYMNKTLDQIAQELHNAAVTAAAEVDVTLIEQDPEGKVSVNQRYAEDRQRSARRLSQAVSALYTAPEQTPLRAGVKEGEPVPVTRTPEGKTTLPDGTVVDLSTAVGRMQVEARVSVIDESGRVVQSGKSTVVRQRQLAMRRLLMTSLIPTYVNRYVLPKHRYWLGTAAMGVKYDYIKNADDKRKALQFDTFDKMYERIYIGTARDYEIGNDLKQTIYTAATEAIDDVIRNLQPHIIDGQIVPNKLEMKVVDSDGNVSYVVKDAESIWRQHVEGAIKRNIDAAVYKLRQKSSEADRTMPSRLVTANNHIKNDTILERYMADNEIKPSTDDSEQVIRAAAVDFYSRFKNNVKDGKKVSTTKLADYLDDMMSANIAPTSVIKKLEPHVAQIKQLIAKVESKEISPDVAIQAITQYVIDNPELRALKSPLRMFYVFHTPYKTPRGQMSNSYYDSVFMSEDGTISVPTYSVGIADTFEKSMQEAMDAFRMSKNVQEASSLDEVVGGEAEGRTLQEEVGVEDEKFDLAEWANSRVADEQVTSRKYRIVEELYKDKTNRDNFILQRLAPVFDAMNKNRVPIITAIDRFEGIRQTMVNRQKEGKRISQTLINNYKRYGSQIKEFNAFTEKENQLGVFDDLFAFGDAILNDGQSPLTYRSMVYDFLTKFGNNQSADVYKLAKIEEYLTASLGELKEQRDAVKLSMASLRVAMTSAYLANNGSKEATELARRVTMYFDYLKQVTASAQDAVDSSIVSNYVSDSYVAAVQDLPVLDAVVLDRRRVQLQTIGIKPVTGFKNKGITVDQLLTGLHIGQPKFDAASSSVIDKLNAIEAKNLEDFYGRETTNAVSVKAVLSTIDSVIAKVMGDRNAAGEKSSIAKELEGMTTNERRLHLMLERVDYAKDVDGDYKKDRIFTILGAALQKANWITGAKKIDDAQGLFGLAVQTLMDTSVIPPKVAFNTYLEKGKSNVTVRTLTKPTTADVVTRAKNALTTTVKVGATPIVEKRALFTTTFSPKESENYQRLISAMYPVADPQVSTVLTDAELAEVVRINNNQSEAIRAINFRKLQAQRDAYVLGGLDTYLSTISKSRQAMTVRELNEYLAGMNSNDSFTVMSNIMKLLTQERSLIMPFVVYSGRLPDIETGELKQLAQSIAAENGEKVENVFGRLMTEYKNLENNIAQFSLEWMTNCATVTQMSLEHNDLDNSTVQFYGLTLVENPITMDPVNAKVRNKILEQEDIFVDRYAKEFATKFSYIHEALEALKSGTEGAEYDYLNDLYRKVKSDTDMLVATSVNDILWGKRRQKGSTAGIPAPGTGTRVPRGRGAKYQVPEFVFAQAVRKRTLMILKDVFRDIKSSDDFAPVRATFKNFNVKTLEKIMASPAEQAKSEYKDLVVRLQALTEAVAKDMVQARAEIIRAANDPKLATYRYVQQGSKDKLIVQVQDVSGKVVMTIDYSNARIVRPGSTPASTPVRGETLSYTQRALNNLLASSMGAEVPSDLANMSAEIKQKYEADLAVRRAANARIKEAVTSLDKVRVMPAEYWYGRHKIEAQSKKNDVTPMFMNSPIIDGMHINDLVGTRDIDTVDNYVKPVINKWINPDENNVTRVQLGLDGVPVYDGYGYTVQTPQGTRSHIYANLVDGLGLPHAKALEVYALTEHPEFKAWQAGDLVDSLHLHDPGSFASQGRPIPHEARAKMQVVLDAKNLVMAIDDYMANQNSQNFERLKHYYDEVFENNWSTEELQQRVQDAVSDNIKLEAVRVQADTVINGLNTPEVSKFTNPVFAHMEGQTKVQTGKPFTTMAFDLPTSGILNHSAPGFVIHDLGSGLHKNPNRRTHPRWIKMQNPYVVDLKNTGVDAVTLQKYLNSAMKKGYDGLVLTNYADSLLGVEKKNVGITFDDANIKSMPTMHVKSTGKAPKAEVRDVMPMFMNPVLAPSTKEVAPTLIAEGMVDAPVTPLEKAQEMGLTVWDNYSAIVRAPLSMDLAMTGIQGGRALLGLVTFRPFDTWHAITALVKSMPGLAPNMSVTLGGKNVGFDKLGRRQYMQAYLELRKDPYWDVMKELKVPLHFMNLERRIEAERDRIYRESGGKLSYEDIPIDLMTYDERGNLTDFFEKNTLIGSLPMQGMFERQISLQHDYLLFSLIKHQLTQNPILRHIPMEDLAKHRDARIAANFCSLSLGDFQYSTNERNDAIAGRAGKALLVAPRWLLSNILINPLINKTISEFPGVSDLARKMMGPDNRVFDLYPKDLWKTNRNLYMYQMSSMVGSALWLLMMAGFAEIKGMLSGDGRYNATLDRAGAYRFNDWKISDSTGTLDFYNVPNMIMKNFVGGDPGKPDSIIQSEQNRWVFAVLNNLGYRASPVITKPYTGLLGKDVINRPVWQTDDALNIFYHDQFQPMMKKQGVTLPETMEIAQYWTSLMPTAATEMMQAYATSRYNYNDKDVSAAIAYEQWLASFFGFRVKYEPYIPHEKMKKYRLIKFRERAIEYAPSLKDMMQINNPKKLFTGI